jgi:transposase-like protein
MSERIDSCPNCKSLDVVVLKRHNPDTTDMNCDASFKCDACQHSWEGRTASAYYYDQISRGFII